MQVTESMKELAVFSNEALNEPYSGEQKSIKVFEGIYSIGAQWVHNRCKVYKGIQHCCKLQNTFEGPS